MTTRPGNLSRYGTQPASLRCALSLAGAVGSTNRTVVSSNRRSRGDASRRIGDGSAGGKSGTGRSADNGTPGVGGAHDSVALVRTILIGVVGVCAGVGVSWGQPGATLADQTPSAPSPSAPSPFAAPAPMSPGQPTMPSDATPPAAADPAAVGAADPAWSACDDAFARAAIGDQGAADSRLGELAKRWPQHPAAARATELVRASELRPARSRRAGPDRARRAGVLVDGRRRVRRLQRLRALALRQRAGDRRDLHARRRRLARAGARGVAQRRRAGRGTAVQLGADLGAAGTAWRSTTASPRAGARRRSRSVPRARGCSPELDCGEPGTRHRATSRSPTRSCYGARCSPCGGT